MSVESLVSNAGLLGRTAAMSRRSSFSLASRYYFSERLHAGFPSNIYKFTKRPFYSKDSMKRWHRHYEHTQRQLRCFATIEKSTKKAANSNKNGDRIELISIIDNLDKLDSIPLADVRNFCIIAHVDHGKSSLASRVLEYTGNLGRDRQLVAHDRANEIPEDGETSGPYDSEGSTSEENESSSTSNNTSSKTTNIQTKDTKEEITLLDTLKVERERGITVKASAASMLYRHPSATTFDTSDPNNPEKGWILLNMVDTPGHADFGMEVSKSLDSVEGAVLLFDAAQGVQAQTLSVYDKARTIGRQRNEWKRGLAEKVGTNPDKRDGEETGFRVLPVLTKIDIPSARPLEVALAVSDLFGFDPDSILKTSARARIGIKEVLDVICDKVPPPDSLADDDGTILRAKVIDSWFEPRRGVVCLVRLLSGALEEGDRISIIDGGQARKDSYSVQEIGLVLPHRMRTKALSRGQMGYVIAGLRDPREARPGTILTLQKTVNTVVGNEMILPPSMGKNVMGQQSVLYASVHPMEGEGFDELQAAVEKLSLNDTGLEIQRTAGSSNNSNGGGPFLGPGLRVGFQGLLHVEVFRQRLLDEFDLEAIVTPPKVPYTIEYLPSKSYKRPSDLPMIEVIEDLIQWPPAGHRFKVMEPVVEVRILAPMDYAGNILELIKRKRGFKMETKPVDEHTWLFTAAMPWADVVTDFHDELKTTSAGYASFDVSAADPPLVEANLTKVDIMLNGEVVDPLAFVCHRDVAQSQARVVCQKLQGVLPRQQFVTVIQAKADGKIIASERIRAYRKDVLTTGGSKAVGGGDITRKKKLLEKQKKGKKRQQSTGRVTLSQAAFNSVISRSS